MSETNYPSKKVALAVLVTAVTLITVFWISYSGYKTLADTVPRAVQMQRYHGDIEHFDEILTLTAKLAASTGDVKWIDHYGAAEVRLVDSFRGALDLSKDDAIRNAAEKIHQHNIDLIDLEQASFALVRSGNSQSAMDILSGERYEKLKQEYSGGVLQLLASIQLNTQDGIERQKSGFSFLLWVVPIVMLAISALWYLVVRSLRRWRQELRDQQYHRAVAESQVKRINHELEQRIAVRTSELQDSERRFHHLAHYDDLTSLPNRRSAIELLSRVLSETKDESQGVVVMLVDLDDFKRVNDSLGHGVGDKLLVHAARRIQKSVRENDSVFRLGGDEFLVLATQDEDSEVDASGMAKRVLDSFEKPFSLSEDRFELSISPSIGVALAPEHGTDVEDLIRHADMAMYAAKYNGRNCYYVFDENMNKHALEQLDLESKLRKAIEYNQLSLHYQPQVDLNSGEIIGVEALLRWSLPEVGNISPMEFIPMAETHGLIIEIGEWVLNRACIQIGQWKKETEHELMLAVNVSPVQLRQSGFFESVMRILNQHGFDPNMLELELTETALLEDAENIQRTLAQLSEAGVRLSLDDFGTGYSALSYLKRYNFDMLKIDRSYVQGMQETEREARLVKAIIAMAHGLDMKIVGEGTETLAQCDLLKNYGCDVAQGYYYSKPLPPAEFLTFMDKWNQGEYAVAS